MDPSLEPSFLKILFTTLKDLSFWTGFVTIVAFSMGRFNEKKPDEQELDPPLPNRCFTSRFRFSSSALIYALVYLSIYSLFVVGGSIPALQGVLTELFGSLDVSEEIGTPAWAAMILMVIAPTFRQVKEVDERLRRWLMDFANIPFEARHLAEEIIVAVRHSCGDGTRRNLHELPVAKLSELYDEITQLRNRLCSEGGERFKSAYNTFFNVKYSGVVKSVDQKYQTVKKECQLELKDHAVAQPAEESASFRRQLADLVQRNGRLIACALLQVESEDHAAREAVRARGGLRDLEPASFRFSKSQIVLGVLLVFVTCVTIGPSVQFIRLGGATTPGEIWMSLQRWAFWGGVGAFSYFLPLVLAASVQLWLLDKEEEAGPQRDWMFKITVLLVTLLGCFLLAGVPMFLGAIIKAKIFDEPYSPLVVAFALVPASIAVLFIPLSRRRINRPRGMNALLDFASFGSAGALVTYCTGSLVKLADLASRNVLDLGPLYEMMIKGLPAISAVAFFIAGGFGALQCAASRQLVEATRTRRHAVDVGVVPATHAVP